MPLISVIIPTFNRSKFLSMAVNSVLRQSIQDFEIIIVDDCSQDDTSEIVDSIKNKKIKYIRHTANKGESGSRNTGISHSDSEYIAFLDDDDEWYVNKLERQISVIRDNPGDFGAVYTGFFYRDIVTGNSIGQFAPREHGYIFNELLCSNCVPGGGSTILLKRECFEEAGLFDPEFKTCADWDMWIRISRNYKFAYVKEPLIYYNQHGNNVTKNLDAFIQGEERIIEKHKSDMQKSPKAYSVNCFALGAFYLLNGDVSKSRDLFIKSVTLYPFHLRPYFYLILSLTGSNRLTKDYLKINTFVKGMLRGKKDLSTS